LPTGTSVFGQILNSNFGGSSDFFDFLFQDTLTFGIFLMSLVPSGLRKEFALVDATFY
jgi:hypothetical protein